MLRAHTVGWIGLGSMGTAMSQRLAESGYQLKAFDLRPKARRSVAPYAYVTNTPCEAATDVEVLAIKLSDTTQLEALLSGPEGFAHCVSPETTVLIMSSIGPEAVEKTAAALAAYTSHVVDAPVSGGPERARRGELVMMVGGAQEDIETVAPLLDLLSIKHPVVGNLPGDGQKFKVVNQLLCGVHLAAAAEALSLAESMGLDVEQCHDVLSSGAAQSFMFQDRGRRMLDEEFAEAISPLDFLTHDIGLVTEAARRVDQPVPLAAAAEQLYVRGHREGLGQLDDSAIYQLVRNR